MSCRVHTTYFKNFSCHCRLGVAENSLRRLNAAESVAGSKGGKSGSDPVLVIDPVLLRSLLEDLQHAARVRSERARRSLRKSHEKLNPAPDFIERDNRFAAAEPVFGFALLLLFKLLLSH